MTYDVEWSNAAVHRLAEVWITAADAGEIAAAVDEAERELAARPQRVLYPLPEAIPPDAALVDLYVTAEESIGPLFAAEAGPLRLVVSISVAERRVLIRTVYRHYGDG